MQLCQVDQVTNLCWNSVKLIVIHAKKLQGYQPGCNEEQHNKIEAMKIQTIQTKKVLNSVIILTFQD